MLIKVDERLSEPIYRQIASQVRRGLAAGKLKAGDRLPAARELAESLDVNVHTVLRALGELREEGLVEMRQGRGVTVIGSKRQADIRQQAKALAAEARRQGLTDTEVVKLVKSYL